jgi:hypothetical protein
MLRKQNRLVKKKKKTCSKASKNYQSIELPRAKIQKKEIIKKKFFFSYYLRTYFSQGPELIIDEATKRLKVDQRFKITNRVKKTKLKYLVGSKKREGSSEHFRLWVATNYYSP